MRNEERCTPINKTQLSNLSCKHHTYCCTNISIITKGTRNRA